jgi:hypothetical protein
MSSIARYTVESLLLPFHSVQDATASARTIRVCGLAQPFSDALSKARGRDYKVTYLDPAEAAEKQEQARLAGDELGEMMWSIRPLVAKVFHPVVLYFLAGIGLTRWQVVFSIQNLFP